MIRKFKKLVILDKIILSKNQWDSIKDMTEEMIKYSGLTRQQIIDKLNTQHNKHSGNVCFTEFAVEKTTEEELIKRIGSADAVITCWTNIPDKILTSLPNIKYIGFWTNLVDHRINLKLAEKLGIKVTYIPDYGTIAVAEFVFAILQEMNRRVSKQAKDTVSGKWSYELLKTSVFVPQVEDIPYHTLSGKKIGIIGLGRIGQHVTHIARGYGMNIGYYSRTRKTDCEKLGIKYFELNELLKWADIITLHLSPYASTAPIITKEKLSLMPDNSIFINTSSGRLVDERALLDEAEQGRIRIAMDVYQNNPDRQKIQQIVQKYGEGKNIFTYRGGWLTQESIILKGEILIKNITDYLMAS